MLGHSGILADRTRVLVTHSVSFLPFVDHIVMLKEGRIIEQGTFIQLVKTNGAFSELVRQLEGQQDKVNSICLVKETITQLSKATSYVTPSVSLGSRN